MRTFLLNADPWLEEWIDRLSPRCGGNATDEQDVASQNHPSRYVRPSHPAGVERRKWDFNDHGWEHDREQDQVHFLVPGWKRLRAR